LNGGAEPESFLDAATVANFRGRPFRGNHSTMYAFASFAGSPLGVIEHVKNSQAARRIPTALHTAMRAVMVSHDQLLRHYGWGDQVAGCSITPWPWEWPAVPPVPRRLLDALERATGRLDELATAERNMKMAALPEGKGQIDADLDAMRRAIKVKGDTASPQALFKIQPIANARGRNALRELERLGEYKGFQRAKPRRYARGEPRA
jgi:hypothetical protein